MRRLLLMVLLFTGFMMLVGCSQTPESTATPVVRTATPQASSTLVVTETAPATEPIPTSLPAATATKPLAETVEPTVVLEGVSMETAVPTLSPSIELTPFTTSYLAFLWAPHLDTDGPDAGVTTNLYFAYPGTSPDTWDIQPVVTELHGWPFMTVSPDKTKLALLLLDDTNLDGTQFYADDFYNIYLYTLAESKLERIVEVQEYTYFLEWQTNSQSLMYPQGTNVFLAHLDGFAPIQLTDFPLSAPGVSVDDNWITNLSLSPKNKILVINTYIGDVSFVSGEGDEKQLIVIGLANNIDFSWSPDGEWLAYWSPDLLGGFYLFNTLSNRIVEMVARGEDNATVTTPVWSNNSRFMAYTQGGSSLYLWDEMQQYARKLANVPFISPPVVSHDGTKFVAAFFDEGKNGFFIFDTVDGSFQDFSQPRTGMGQITSPAWSPDGLKLAAAFSDEEQSGFFIYDTLTGNLEEFVQSVHMEGARMLNWSPGGERIAFFAIRDGISGFYLFNPENGEIDLILDTTSMIDPTSLVWLP